MTPGEARFVHASTLLVGATGVVYGWMLYFAEPADEFALVNHPLQPHFLHLHVLFAPLLVFGCGLIWRDHVWARVRSRFPVRRRTGLALTALVVPMIASGYLLQTTAEPAWQRAWVVVHVATSVLWVVGYAVHQLSPRRRREPAPVEPEPEPGT